jgi:hypothetical protein
MKRFDARQFLSKGSDPAGPIREFKQSGLLVLDHFLCGPTLKEAQKAFAAEAECLNWNRHSGYFVTDPYRRMVPDVLRLSPGFVRAPLHPLVKAVCRDHLGDGYALTEAKGWRSMPTSDDFHGWHNDAWYAPEEKNIPPQVKLAVYLSDVHSGEFCYFKGSQGRHRPGHWSNAEVAGREEEPTRVKGLAGTGILFESSGIHRQAMPIPEVRDAVFFVFHDPDVPLQHEDLAFGRYHPLVLSAAFLGGLGEDDQRILGFGDGRLLNGKTAPKKEAEHWVAGLTRAQIRLPPAGCESI